MSVLWAVGLTLVLDYLFNPTLLSHFLYYYMKKEFITGILSPCHKAATGMANTKTRTRYCVECGSIHEERSCIIIKTEHEESTNHRH